MMGGVSCKLFLTIRKAAIDVDHGSNYILRGPSPRVTKSTYFIFQVCRECVYIFSWRKIEGEKQIHDLKSRWHNIGPIRTAFFKVCYLF